MHEYIRVQNKQGVEFDAVSTDPRIGGELKPIDDKNYPPVTMPRPAKFPESTAVKEHHGSDNQ